MDFLRSNSCFYTFIIAIVVIITINPVLAQEDGMIISYRGPGGYYIGDTIILDGKNTLGNATLLKISGPDLPSAGVPVSDLNGIPGSGTIAPMNDDGSWKFVWSSANTVGGEKLLTARYTITSFDPAKPQNSASVSIHLKKPDFYVYPQQGQITPGDYVQLNGIAERGVTEVKIDITDPNGTILHSHTSSVSSSGYFGYGFRADLHPGKYFVSVTSPSVKNVFSTSITVMTSNEPVSAAQPSPISTPSESVSVAPTLSPVLTRSTSPSETPFCPLTIIAGIIISALIVIVRSPEWRK